MPVVPGVPGAALPPGDDAIIRRIQELERAVRELSAANPLATAGLVPSLNKLTVQGELDVTGPMVVGGTLSLPAGIIGNDALANPVAWVYQTTSQTNFALSTTYTSLATVSLVTPTGFNSAVYLVWGNVQARNPTAAADFLWAEAGFAGDTSGGIPWQVGAGSYGTAGILGVVSRTSLTPGVGVNLAVRAFAQGGTWSASSTNTAFTRAVGLYFHS